MCKGTCDNCMRVKGTVEMKDMTLHAKNIYNLVQGNTLGMTAVVDIYRGCGAKKVAEYSSNYYFGKGKELSKIVVERLVKMLIAKGYLTEKVMRNKGGFSWVSYKTGKKIVGKVELGIEEQSEKQDNKYEQKSNQTNKTTYRKK
ncbi:ATP-dependent DNA helicase sgs1 [Binucleata daphniae]